MLPSLLYNEKPLDKKISLSVFRDLQLFNFIPESSAKCVLRTCSEENRRARQSLISRLVDDDGALTQFEKLTALSYDLTRADGVYNSARTETEKRLLFVNLMNKYAVFANAADLLDFGDPLSSSLSSAFKKIVCSEKFKECLADLSGADDSAKHISSFSLTISGDKIRRGRTEGEPFCSTIIDKSVKLGIALFLNDTKPEQARLSSDIIEYAASRDESKRKDIYDFFDKYFSLYDESVRYYYDEFAFYVSVTKLIKKAKNIGISFCFPSFSDSRVIKAANAYDITLIAKGESNIVPNDVLFSDTEPFFYLTGANDGGKTTYLRTVGVLVLLFLLGCPVPAENAEIGGVNCIYTHFPRDERFDGSGRFIEEKTRVDEILGKCDKSSLVLLNETFSATNEENAIKFTTELAHRLNGDGVMGLYITHQHDISASETIPFLQVVVDENDGNRRTFKIRRSRNSGGSFAGEILERYGLMPEALKERFEPLIGSLNGQR